MNSKFIDFYELLEVNIDATTEEIKRAFREKAKIWHPDVNKAPEAEEIMKLLIEAKLILTDPEARKLYDAEWKKFKKYTEEQKINDFSQNKYSYDYQITNDILIQYLIKAKKKAEDFIKQTVQDTIGIGKDAAKGCFTGLIQGIIVSILISLFFSILFLTCN